MILALASADYFVEDYSMLNTLVKPAAQVTTLGICMATADESGVVYSEKLEKEFFNRNLIRTGKTYTVWSYEIERSIMEYTIEKNTIKFIEYEPKSFRASSKSTHLGSSPFLISFCVRRLSHSPSQVQRK